MLLTDKNIVVTGASGGIGGAFAHRLAEAGARVILVGRDRDRLARQAGRISTELSLPAARTPVIVTADITTGEGLDAVLHACTAHGVDVLVNNAGSQLFGFFAGQTPADIAALVHLNLVAPMLLTRQLLPLLEARPEAAVVNIGSTFGTIGHPAFASYCASKFGLRGFSESLRRELADSVVNVHHLAPRATRTDLNGGQVVAMNESLGNAMDEPDRVAKELVRLLQKQQGKSRVIGWPEKLFVVINSLLPQVVDRVMAKQLRVVRHHASPSPEPPVSSTGRTP